MAALFVPCLAAILFPVFQQAKVAALRTRSIVNMKQIGVAHLMYAADNDDRLCAAHNWEKSLSKFLDSEEALRDPTSEPAGKYGYAMNDGAAGSKTATTAA